MKRLFIVMAGLLSSIYVLAQQNLDLQKPTFHSPTAVELGKYIDHPVNHSTGIPSVSVPLYTIKSGKLTLPISLSYHAGGIKVDQEATPVGLGWVLNAGGNISRVVNDKPDETGFINYGDTLPVFNGPEDLAPGVKTGWDNLRIYQWYNSDKEADLYYLNAGGLSGQFVLNNSDQYVSLGMDSLRIDEKPLMNGNNLIIVRDKLGNIYRFGRSLNNAEAFETTDNENWFSNGDGQTHFTYPHITNWYLTEIISADLTDTISFLYETKHYGTQKVTSAEFHTLLQGSVGGVIDQMGTNHEETTYSAVKTTIHNLRIIKEIRFREGRIVFDHINDRQDMLVDNVVSGGVNIAAITRIAGYSLYNFHDSLLAKAVFDNNAYFNRLGQGIYDDISSSYDKTAREKALKLEAVHLYDSENKKSGSFSFEYDSTPLPRFNSKAQDFWGYYNGKTSGNFIPTTYYLNSFGKPRTIGANREADFNYTKAASLTKITYPTGGFTVYEYEPHYYLDAQQSAAQEEVIKSIGALAMNASGCPSNPEIPYPPASKVVEFTVNETLAQTAVTGKLNIFFSNYQNAGPSSGYLTCKITRPHISLGSVTDVYYHNPSANSMHIIQDIVIEQAGEYKIELLTNGATGSTGGPAVWCETAPYIEAIITYPYLTTVPVINEPKQAGGLRVKKIDTYSAESKIELQKRYEYGKPSTLTNEGIGELITDPNYNFYYYPVKYCYYKPDEYDAMLGVNPLFELRDAIWITSSSQVEIGTNNGTSIFYPLVTEFVTDKNNNAVTNGKTEYYFLPKMGYYEPKPGQRFPYNNISYPAWSEVLLDSVIQYSQLPDLSYKRELETKHEYEIQDLKDIRTLKIYNFKAGILINATDGGYGMAAYNQEYYYYYNHFIPRGRILKKREITKSYHHSNQYALQQKEYEYNPQFDLKKEKFLNSKGQLVEYRTKYSYDIGYSALTDKHILSAPVQSEVVIDGQIKSGTILKYNNNGSITEHYAYSGSTSIAPPAFTTYASIPSGYALENILVYNAKNRMVQSTDKGGFSTTHLWGYRGSYPVATIAGLDYATVSGLYAPANLFEDMSETGVSAKLTSLRTALSGTTGLVSSYTYQVLKGASSETDSRGNTIYYEYDKKNRLSIVRDKDLKVIRKICYSYTGEEQSCSGVFTNIAKSGVFTRNNCSSGGVGGSITYAVPAGIYSSFISQADADQQAQNDVNANGQSYANTNATCTWVNAVRSASFTRNNCSGGTGGSVTYTVPAGTHSSTVSQADADQKAQSDINMNGQNYANVNGTCGWTNVVKSGNFTRNNCSAGYVGSTVTYTVPAGTYTSTVSQADADQQAQNAVNANGQSYANNNGTCISTSCSFSAVSNWQIASGSINRSGSTVTFSLTVTVQGYSGGWGGPVRVATINGACIPSAGENFSFSAGGRNWMAIITSGGDVLLQLLSGSAPGNGTSIAIPSNSFNL